MQWDASPHAGFSAAEPWLPVDEGYLRDNVERERADPGSMLNLYRRLIAVRRRFPALSIGDYRPVEAGGTCWPSSASRPESAVLVALNLGAEAIPLAFPDRPLRGEVLVSSRVCRTAARAPCAFSFV